jgi:Uma2 family endonuclease
MTTQPKAYLSAQEYLHRERSGDAKHEYLAGDVFAMAGGSEEHNLIVGNTLASLHAQLRRRPCRVYPSDMRVKVEQTGLYTYPDITVVCGQPQFEDEHRDTLMNPTVIIEVLSPSTERYDRGKKFQNYRTIASLQEYLLISQDACRLEHYARQPDNQWLLSEASSLEAVMSLPSVACLLALKDVYEKVELAAE